MENDLPTPIDVLDFWWEAGEAKWFSGDEEFDVRCRNAFLPAVEAAQRGLLDSWKASPDGALALILLLDQLTRNVYRGSAKAFEADAKALEVARHALEMGFDKAFPKSVRVFFYLPYEHSETMADQELAVDLCRALGEMSYYHYALIHMDVIRRFGRFPHRNAVLGRKSTDAEIAFLENGGFSA